MPVHGLLPVDHRLIGTTRKTNGPLGYEVWILDFIPGIARPIDPRRRRVDVSESRRQVELVSAHGFLNNDASFWVDLFHDTVDLCLPEKHAVVTIDGHADENDSSD